MKISVAIVFGFLVLATVLTLAAEIIRREKVASYCFWAALMCLYGVCIGIAALVIGYFFNFSDPLAIAIAVPVGFAFFSVRYDRVVIVVDCGRYTSGRTARPQTSLKIPIDRPSPLSSSP